MAKKKLYSYIRHPFCKNGWHSLVLSLLAFILTGAVSFFAVKRAGNIGLVSAAVGISSILIDLTSFIFISMSFKEKQKNYTFAIISLVIAICVLVEWVYIFTR